MKDTGVWCKCELDDEGNIYVKVTCAAEWNKGETVKVAEDITDRIPKELINNLKSSLNKIIDASKKSMTDNAEAAAVQMREFKLGRQANRVTKLDFAGSIAQEGKSNAS